LVPHGEWLKLLKDECELLPRQAQRYMQLARQYAAATATCKSHLVGLSIEAAIKQLSAPEKGTHRREAKTAPRREHNGPTPTGFDIYDLWDRATMTERTRFLRNVGLNSLAQALPRDWLRLIERYLREQIAALPAPSEPPGDDYPKHPDFL
jgi:hypothetical protein